MSRARRPGPKMGSDEWKARVVKGQQHTRRRRRKEITTRPAHVDNWLQIGLVADELAPIVRFRAGDVAAMVEDLGGKAECTSLQKAVLEGWFQAQVAADCEFQRLLLAHGVVPDRLMTAINAARAALIGLGLERKAAPVASLESMGYVEVVEPVEDREQAPEDRPGETITVDPLSAPSAPGNGAAQGEPPPGGELGAGHEDHGHPLDSRTLSSADDRPPEAAS